MAWRRGTSTCRRRYCGLLLVAAGLAAGVEVVEAGLAAGVEAVPDGLLAAAPLGLAADAGGGTPDCAL